jgi:hypothetical protein
MKIMKLATVAALALALGGAAAAQAETAPGTDNQITLGGANDSAVAKAGCHYRYYWWYSYGTYRYRYYYWCY